MKLIIGGYAQGKLEYVVNRIGNTEHTVLEGSLSTTPEHKNTSVVIVNCLHEYVRNRLKEGGNPEMEIMQFVDLHPDCVMISDEIGNGIVPVDAFERECRERTGRILVELAKRAEEVERAICGIGQRIKWKLY